MVECAAQRDARLEHFEVVKFENPKDGDDFFETALIALLKGAMLKE